MNSELERPPDPLPEIFNYAQHALDANLRRHSKPAFVDDQGAVTYGQLDDRVRRTAAGFRELGVKRRDRVLILMEDTTDWPVVFLGAIYSGIVAVPVNTLLTADDYAYILEHSRARAVLVSGTLLPALTAAMTKSGRRSRPYVIVSRPVTPLSADQLEFQAWLSSHPPNARAAATSADEPAFWLYSSGSTGRPKGAVHLHGSPYWTSRLYGQGVLGVREDDVCFSAAKLFFAYGLGNALTFPLATGATALLMSTRPTPDAVFKRWTGGIGGIKPTIFYGAPTGYAGILASPNIPPREMLVLRLASSAGEALPADIGRRFKDRFGIDIVDGIGSTEMLHTYMSNRPGDVRYGTTGWPVPGYDIALRADDGGAVPDGQPGDLFVRGPSSAVKYWANRAKTLATFQNGWTRSGDKYVRNADGTYTYCGRTDDMLKVSGQYVSPFEVEATLVEHQAVLEAAVIGVTDADGLTRTKAFVVLKSGVAPSEAELKDFVKSRLAPYKYPRLIEFIDKLPKTATGKIQRFRLRERQRQ